MSPKVEIQDLVTPTQAAKLKGVTRQWVDSLMRRNKIEAIKIAGKRFVRLQDVLSYKPTDTGGRPSKYADKKKGSKR